MLVALERLLKTNEAYIAELYHARARSKGLAAHTLIEGMLQEAYSHNALLQSMIAEYDED